MSDFNTGSDLDPEKNQDAYTVVNARVGVGASNNRWQVELWGLNIFDEEYFFGAAGFMVRPGEPLTARLSARYDF